MTGPRRAGRMLLALWLVAVTCVCSGVDRAEAATDPPCTACITLALASNDAAAVVTAAVPVRGLTVVIPSETPAEVTGALIRAGSRVWMREEAADRAAADADRTPGLAGVWLRLADGLPSDAAIFQIRSSATALRASAPERSIGVILSSSLASLPVAHAIAPYIDAVWIPSGIDLTPDVVRTRFPGLTCVAEASGDDVLAAQPPFVDSRVVRPGADIAQTIRLLGTLRDWLPPGLTPLDAVTVECGGCRAEVWLHPDTLDAIAVVTGPATALDLRVQPAALHVTAVDPGTPDAARELALSASGTGAVAHVDGSSGRLVLRIAGWRGTDESVYRSGVEVLARRTLTVDEILARHQAQRARQAALVQNSVAEGRTTLTFEVPGFAGPVTITADTTIFMRGPLKELAHEHIAVNGVDMSVTSRVPRLPIIEPERVSVPPLEITLSAAYRYRLAGRETIGRRQCYVLAFEPVNAAESSFAGHAWIDDASFALVKMDAVQTGLSGAITSSEQRDEYEPLQVDGRDVWLPVRMSSFQIYQAAGQRTPIHREVVTTSRIVNASDFDERLRRAHDSPAVMLRDTPEGYRYLVPPKAASGGGSANASGTRVVAPRAGQRVITLAFGIIDDPNITVPLPYAGLSYLDFNLFGRGIQFSGFFGGTYGQLAWTVPRVIRPGWQLTGRVFGIAVAYNDRKFENGVEQYDQNIEQRPFQADVALVAPLSPRVQLRLGYDLNYVHFQPGSDTSPDFVIPASTPVHGARVALAWSKGPWSGLAWWNPARRQSWHAWGIDAAEYTPDAADFQRYGVTAARSWVVGRSAVARVEGNWMDGHDLDRFSRYTVDSFENVLHGYPSASLRFDHGVIARSVGTWSPASRLRLDGFFDCAWVHDPGFGDGLLPYPGVGTAAEIPLPGRFLIAVEWGYGFKARNTNGTEGAQVVRVSGFRVF